MTSGPAGYSPGMTTEPIAVTGASGNIGTAVLQGLIGGGGREPIALVRDPSRLRVPHPAVRTRVADYSDRASLVAALRGVRTLVFISSDGETAPMLVHHLNVLESAQAVGVQHVVYLSIVDVDPSSPFCFAPVHAETERRLVDSGISYVVLRAGMYTEFFGRWIVEAGATGTLRLPMGGGRVSLVARADVASCLLAAVERRLTGVHVVTGDRSYDLDGLGALTEDVFGRPVHVEEIGHAELCAGLLRQGVEPWWAYAFTSMFEAIGQHRFEDVTTTVAELTWRAPLAAAKVLRS